VRGKKGNAATNRRNFTELESRAETAEHQAARLGSELNNLRERTDQQIIALQRECRELKDQRDSAASPLLTAAEDRIRELMSKLQAEKDWRGDLQKKRDKEWLGMRKLLMVVLGVTPAEALEVLAMGPDELVFTNDQGATWNEAG
jgi:predicted  nucleic acid-binding Zn-ribbon protein